MGQTAILPEDATTQVESVDFSESRGFYSNAFYLILTTNTDGATVYYTTNGSLPTPETASIALDQNQAFPLIISETTCCRLENMFALEERAPITVKGKKEPQRTSST